jgi:hypothetical protein
MQPPLVPEAQVLDRVLSFRGENKKPGSAFAIDVGGEQYLVTAAHLTSGERDEYVLLTSWAIDGGEPQTSVSSWCSRPLTRAFSRPRFIGNPLRCDSLVW